MRRRQRRAAGFRLRPGMPPRTRQPLRKERCPAAQRGHSQCTHLNIHLVHVRCTCNTMCTPCASTTTVTYPRAAPHSLTTRPCSSHVTPCHLHGAAPLASCHPSWPPSHAEFQACTEARSWRRMAASDSARGTGVCVGGVGGWGVGVGDRRRRPCLGGALTAGMARCHHGVPAQDPASLQQCHMQRAVQERPPLQRGCECFHDRPCTPASGETARAVGSSATARRSSALHAAAFHMPASLWRC